MANTEHFTTLSIRVSVAQLDQAKRWAKAKGGTLSDLARDAFLPLIALDLGEAPMPFEPPHVEEKPPSLTELARSLGLTRDQLRDVSAKIVAQVLHDGADLADLQRKHRKSDPPPARRSDVHALRPRPLARVAGH